MICTTTSAGKEQGCQPDVSVVDTIWEANRAAYSALLSQMQLPVEVVSTNWEDDYIDKLGCLPDEHLSGKRSHCLADFSGAFVNCRTGTESLEMHLVSIERDVRSGTSLQYL